MKKLIYSISLCLMAIVMSACGHSGNQLENMTTQQSNDYVAIVWNDRVYVPFCGIDNGEHGAQIGIVDGDKNDQVYEYKNHSTKDWIISFYKSGVMDTSMLMKEINVKQIPDNLQSDYDWNNK